jgi:uncharacterized protein with NRDE domain
VRYGTRSTTVICVRRDGFASFIERSFDPQQPDRHFDRHYEFMVNTLPEAAGRRDKS